MEDRGNRARARQLKRGYLGIAGQPVALPDSQRGDRRREHALLVVGVTSGSPAAAAGVSGGRRTDRFDGHASNRPRILLDLLVGDRVGREARAARAARRGSST